MHLRPLHIPSVILCIAGTLVLPEARGADITVDRVTELARVLAA